MKKPREPKSERVKRKRIRCMVNRARKTGDWGIPKLPSLMRSLRFLKLVREAAEKQGVVPDGWVERMAGDLSKWKD